uniref:Uncharacterized protein LOC111138419 n=1 Tax=Crassostrea virginica TaxID=6565 RepID=A0A8B8F188_CRAVI|nr:uncharacterized protein LOC111138419 [Crassostrea virginica]
MQGVCFILLISLCFVVEIDGNCGTHAYCTLLEWMSWEACKGQCGGTTKQIRKRSVCVDTTKIQPFTKENVIAYCKFTDPLEETKVCPWCSHGLYNSTTQSCDYCHMATDAENMKFTRPDWLHYLEICIISLISTTALMAAGCACMKCCKWCGYCSADDDDDDDDDDKKGRKAMTNYKLQKPRSFMKHFV